MKINLSVFKDEDAKDAVTYQSWRWDLMGTGVPDVGIILSYHTPSGPSKAIWENWCRVLVWT